MDAVFGPDPSAWNAELEQIKFKVPSKPGPANKGPDGKYSRLSRQYVSEWAWLCSNKTL